MGNEKSARIPLCGQVSGAGDQNSLKHSLGPLARLQVWKQASMLGSRGSTARAKLLPRTLPLIDSI